MTDNGAPVPQERAIQYAEDRVCDVDSVLRWLRLKPTDMSQRAFNELMQYPEFDAMHDALMEWLIEEYEECNVIL